MTTDYQLKFAFHGFWQVSTGRGGGAALDMLSHRDADGLPCLPGRSVKGLLRDAVYRAECWGYVKAGTAQAWFGSLTNVQEAEHRVSLLETEPGCLFVSDAVVASEVGNYLSFLRNEERCHPPNSQEAKQKKAEVESLLNGFFHPIAATAMQDGVAQDKSLRSIEVVIPLDLYAKLHAPQEWPRAELEKCLPLIRAAGGGNNRGLGRVTVTLEQKS